MFRDRRLVFLAGGRRGRWRVGEGDDLEGAHGLSGVYAERFRPVVVYSDPNLGSTGERGHFGNKCGQAFLQAEVYILAGPGVVVADQMRCFGGYLNGL